MTDYFRLHILGFELMSWDAAESSGVSGAVSLSVVISVFMTSLELLSMCHLTFIWSCDSISSHWLQIFGVTKNVVWQSKSLHNSNIVFEIPTCPRHIWRPTQQHIRQTDQPRYTVKGLHHQRDAFILVTQVQLTDLVWFGYILVRIMF